ncbi:plasmid mobilization protein [Flavobacterium sp. RHBU_24]|uniref:plasmid mobilization protein n=1 Tax=Flavobacterium sp. RHBU_24 TaxID=3391185 RepID=UPI003984940E
MEAGTYKTKWLHLRLTPDELKELHGKFSKTTCRNLSQYARIILFNRPVVAFYRNKSQDDLIQQLAALNRELESIGNNLNQVTKKMHTLQPPEQRLWGLQFKGQAEAVLLKIDKVKEIMQQLSNRWLR